MGKNGRKDGGGLGYVRRKGGEELRGGEGEIVEGGGGLQGVWRKSGDSCREYGRLERIAGSMEEIRVAGNMGVGW